MTDTKTAPRPSQAAASVGGAAKQPVADKLHAAASAIRNKAESLYVNRGISEGVSDVAQSAADRMDSSAEYLESHDARQMIQDLFAVVKRNPLRSLLIASALGFVCWRAFRSSPSMERRSRR